MKLIGTAPFAKVTIVKDGLDVYVITPRTREVDFTWRDEAAQAGQDVILLRTRRTVRRAVSLDQPDVDHSQVFKAC